MVGISEQHRLIDPDNPCTGNGSLRAQAPRCGISSDRSNRDRDIGLYFQDAWKPTTRLTLNLGLRVDFVHRYDALFDFTRMDTTVFGPRAGFSYLVTEDARNVLARQYRADSMRR